LQKKYPFFIFSGYKNYIKVNFLSSDVDVCSTFYDIVFLQPERCSILWPYSLIRLIRVVQAKTISQKVIIEDNLWRPICVTHFSKNRAKTLTKERHSARWKREHNCRQFDSVPSDVPTCCDFCTLAARRQSACDQVAPGQRNRARQLYIEKRAAATFLEQVCARPTLSTPTHRTCTPAITIRSVYRPSLLCAICGSNAHTYRRPGWNAMPPLTRARVSVHTLRWVHCVRAARKQQNVRSSRSEIKGLSFEPRCRGTVIFCTLFCSYRTMVTLMSIPLTSASQLTNISIGSNNVMVK